MVLFGNWTVVFESKKLFSGIEHRYSRIEGGQSRIEHHVSGIDKPRRSPAGFHYKLISITIGQWSLPWTSVCASESSSLSSSLSETIK